MTAEKNSDIDRIPMLLDRWCERRAWHPLATLLPGWFCINGLSDGWEIFRESLRHTRARCRHELPADEPAMIGEAIAEIDFALNRLD